MGMTHSRYTMEEVMPFIAQHHIHMNTYIYTYTHTHTQPYTNLPQYMCIYMYTIFSNNQVYENFPSMSMVYQPSHVFIKKLLFLFYMYETLVVCPDAIQDMDIN